MRRNRYSELGWSYEGATTEAGEARCVWEAGLRFAPDTHSHSAITQQTCRHQVLSISHAFSLPWVRVFYSLGKLNLLYFCRPPYSAKEFATTHFTISFYVLYFLDYYCYISQNIYLSVSHNSEQPFVSPTLEVLWIMIGFIIEHISK